MTPPVLQPRWVPAFAGTAFARIGIGAATLALAAGCTAGPRNPATSGIYAEPRDFTVLFDGSSLEGWEQVGPGGFVLQRDGSMVTDGGMGLLYYARRPFRDFVLELEYRSESPGANSGIFVRFPDRPSDPWDAVRGGYEIQIDDLQDPINMTGSVYSFAAPFRLATRPAGEWNQYRIVVTGQRYQIYLNGEKVNDFIGDRGREGYIGLQNHDPDSRVHFRNIRIAPLRIARAPERLGDLVAAPQRDPIRVLMVTGTTGFRHGPAIEASHEVLREIARTTELEVEITEDVAAFDATNLARFDVLFLANSTLRVAEPDDPSVETPARLRPGAAALVTPAQQQAIRDFVRSGKGLVVSHAGLDAFYGWQEYRGMVGGGLFREHPWVRPVRIRVEEPANPSVEHLGNSFWIRDEIYVLDQNPRWNSRVLLSLDMQSVGVVQGNADATPDDYPISWIRRHGEGRVFVTSLGHFPDVWRNPHFVRHLLEGFRLAAGRTEADFSGQRIKETLATGLWATNLAIDARENVWVVELTGKLHRYDPQTGRTTLVGEIPTTDPTQIEHGFYGVAVDPNFYEGEPYIYAYYAQRETFINTLSRFTVRNGQIDLSSERVLLRVPTEPACCHQAGDVHWGPDGTLLVSTGDTGQSSVLPTNGIAQERLDRFVERNELSGHHWARLVDSERTSQNLQDLRGKILRIHKDGSIPRDNPFFGKPGVRWEIYAYGLRNPYRFSYDEATGRLYIGVVGPDSSADYDEYVVSRNGGENFGWPRTIGTIFFNEWRANQIPGYAPPLWEYSYQTGARSAHFGPVYRPADGLGFPALDGKVVLFDWSRRWIKYADVVNSTFHSDTVNTVRTDGRVERMPALRLENIRTFDVLDGTSPIAVQKGRDGCLYVAEFDGFWRGGPNSNLSRYCWSRGAPRTETTP